MLASIRCVWILYIILIQNTLKYYLKVYDWYILSDIQINQYEEVLYTNPVIAHKHSQSRWQSQSYQSIWWGNWLSPNDSKLISQISYSFQQSYMQIKNLPVFEKIACFGICYVITLYFMNTQHSDDVEFWGVGAYLDDAQESDMNLFI